MSFQQTTAHTITQDDDNVAPGSATYLKSQLLCLCLSDTTPWCLTTAKGKSMGKIREAGHIPTRERVEQPPFLYVLQQSFPVCQFSAFCAIQGFASLALRVLLLLSLSRYCIIPRSLHLKMHS
mmetsp:Transcript_24581/g.54763  ORF Transcript_24581/g.54763 Transcript_24581/m.54763 type:complete len:123 (+) Transcript_24581:1269-1637(+)